MRNSIVKSERVNHYMYQKVDTINGILMVGKDKKLTEEYHALKLTGKEFWTTSDSDESISEIEYILRLRKHEKLGRYINDIIYGDTESEKDEMVYDLIDYINSKRALAYEIEGKIYFIAIPSDIRYQRGVLDFFNKLLLNSAIAYYDYKNGEKEEKSKLLEKFLKSILNIRVETNKRIFSKEFKHKFRFRFRGISGVILTGNLGVDEIEIPKWYAEQAGINIGDLVLVERDPVQNIFITLKVVGFTENEIRINAITALLMDADFDGDRAQVMPVKFLIEESVKFGANEFEEIIILKELESLKPSIVMNTEEYKHLLTDYSLDMEEDERYYSSDFTMLDLLDEASPKNEKYYSDAGPDMEKGYIDTVLNMRGVKEGTAIAGSFCNLIMENARISGIDNILARALSNRYQRNALDLKHNGEEGGFKVLDWYLLSELKRYKFKNIDECKKMVMDILGGKIKNVKQTEEEITEDNISSIL